MPKGDRGGRRRGGSEGLDPGDIRNTSSLISEREGKQALVDATLATLKDFRDEYGAEVGDLVVATITGKGASTMAYSDGENIGVNKSYFSDRMETAYADCVKSGFHPSNGNKTALQAVVAHEMGHNLTAIVGQKLGTTIMDSAADRIVREARQATGHRGVVQMASRISKYATYSNAEAVAEAVADIYCNGSRAKAESRAIVNVINKYLR